MEKFPQFRNSAIPQFFVAAAIIFSVTACNKRVDIAALNSAEAVETAMQEANGALRKGDYNKAFGLFEAVAIAQPSNALAHLQAAIVLQDRMGDNAAAIHHFRAYIRLEPGTDKAAMAAERLELARRRLAGAAFPGETAGTENGHTAAGCAADFAATTNALARANAEIAGFRELAQKLDEENARLQKEINRLVKYVEITDGGASSPIPPSGLDEFRIQHGLAPREQNPKPPVKNHTEPKYRTVEVRPGDTLWSIAQDYLYDGSRAPEIRTANPGLIGADGVLEPGIIMNLPVK